MSFHEDNFENLSLDELKHANYNPVTFFKALDYYIARSDLRALDVAWRIFEVVDSPDQSKFTGDCLMLLQSVIKFFADAQLEEIITDAHYCEKFISYLQVYLALMLTTSLKSEDNSSENMLCICKRLNELWKKTSDEPLLRERIKEVAEMLAFYVHSAQNPIVLPEIFEAYNDQAIDRYGEAAISDRFGEEALPVLKRMLDTLIADSELVDFTDSLDFDSSKPEFDEIQDYGTLGGAKIDHVEVLLEIGMRTHDLIHKYKTDERLERFVEGQEYVVLEDDITVIFENIFMEYKQLYFAILETGDETSLNTCVWSIIEMYNGCVVLQYLTTEFERSFLDFIVTALGSAIKNTENLQNLEKYFETIINLAKATCRRYHDVMVPIYQIITDAWYKYYIGYTNSGNVRVTYDNDLPSLTDLYDQMIAIILTGYSKITEETLLWDVYENVAKTKMLHYVISKLTLNKNAISTIEVKSNIDSKLSNEIIAKSIPENGIFVDLYFQRKQLWNTDDYFVIPFVVKKTGALLFPDEIAGRNELVDCFAVYLGEILSNSSRKRSMSKLSFTEAKARLGEMTHYLLSEFENDGIKHISFSSEGVLNGMSFGALPYKDGYIIDYFTVRNVANVFDLANSHSRENYEDSLLVYPVDFEKYKTLNYSEVECSALRETCESIAGKKVVSLSRRSATKSQVVENVRGKKYDIMHFSTHGNAEDGRLFMVLSDDEEDYRLYEDELIDLAVRTNIAVFSFCFGGKMNEDVKDSLSGFIKAMLVNGATTVIAPLEEVDDKATSELFRIFYNDYLEKDKSMSITSIWHEALKKFRTPHQTDNGFCDYSDPKYWAQWVIYSSERMV